MGKFMWRLFLGVLVGIGMAIIWVVLGLLLGGMNYTLTKLLDWPVDMIEQLNHYLAGRLYKDYYTMFLLVAVFWMLVGEVCFWTVVVVRAVRRKPSETKLPAFPVKKDET